MPESVQAVGRQPYVLVLGEGQVTKILRKEASADEEKPALVEVRFIVVASNDILLEVLAPLEETKAEVAVVTPQGQKDAPEKVIGILGREEIFQDILRASKGKSQGNH